MAADEMDTTERLRRHIQMLAETIGERHVWRPAALAEAADYVERQFREAQYDVQRQPYVAGGVTVANLEATLPGTSRADDIVVIGAHYDTIEGSPGANDNGSGVAATLELARRFAGRPLPRTVRFVAFVNEEPPFFHTSAMGSLVYAEAARARGERITAMLSMETIGYYSDEKGSQQYPGPLALMFPDVGNFIGVVGNAESMPLLTRTRESFEAHSRVPIHTAALPSGVPGAAWSDHWAFWQAGYQAVMVTDTAPFRYPWYHTPQDTPDKICYDRLTEVIDGFEHVLTALATL